MHFAHYCRRVEISEIFSKGRKRNKTTTIEIFKIAGILVPFKIIVQSLYSARSVVERFTNRAKARS